MKKSLFIIPILTFSFIWSVFANMWPSSIQRQWTISFNSDSELAKNVSVEKEIIILKVNKNDIYKKDAKYIWYDFLNSKWITNNYIKNHLICIVDGISYTPQKNAFYKIIEDHSFSWSVDFRIQYFLKNNSDKKIENEKVTFSSLKNEWFNYSFPWESLDPSNFGSGLIYDFSKMQYFIAMYNENYYPKNINISLWNNKLELKDDYIIDTFYENDNEYIKYPKNNMIIKKGYTFNLSLEPNETKTLTITYSIPLNNMTYNHNGVQWINYDFSPIFNWKNWIVKEVDIWVIWDNRHIINSSESYFYSDTLTDTGWNLIETPLNFLNSERNIYITKFYNVDKSKWFDGLNISFNSTSDIISWYFCWLWAINASFFCSDDNWIGRDYIMDWIKYEPKYKDIKASKDTENVIIDYKDWTSKEYKIFDLLK